jgi:hypothetical protein
MSIMDLNESGKLELDFYFDFSDSWSYQTALWLRDLADLLGNDLVDLRWFFFANDPASLENTSEGAGAAFVAGAAAQKSGGSAALSSFYFELGKLQFEQNLPLNAVTIGQAAANAGADISGAGDPSVLAAVQQSHSEAVAKYGIKASSSIVFEEKYAVHVHIMPHPPLDKVIPVFTLIQQMAMVEKTIYGVTRILNAEQEAELATTIASLYAPVASE